MSSAELAKISFKTAAEVGERCRLGDEARALVSDGVTPRAFLKKLAAQSLPLDAIRFLAHALPKREAVWWACACAEQLEGAAVSAEAALALNAAKTWVIDPSDENRRAAFKAAEAADFGTPAGCAALAAYLSGGSLTPANVKAVPPAEHLTADMVTASLTLAGVIREPEKSAEKYASFLNLGLEVASGQRVWPEAPKPASGAPASGYARRPRR
jgi:hypothetical protein